MLKKLFAALMTVIVCTGGVVIAATVPETSAPPAESAVVNSASEQAVPEEAAAEDIALEAAGLTREQVRFDRTELDRERGVTVWEVEFASGGVEYDFEIDAYTGEVLKSKTEKDDVVRPTDLPQVSDNPTEPEQTLLEAAAAEDIALNGLGLAREQVRFDRTELDDERGVTVWEVELVCEGIEYDFEIDAYTGEILQRKQEDKRPSAVTESKPEAQSEAQPDTAELTKEQALAIALADAGVSAEHATRAEVEKDFDDGVWLFEIEFNADGYEYEYEVRASDGKILDFDKEWDD